MTLTNFLRVCILCGSLASCMTPHSLSDQEKSFEAAEKQNLQGMPTKAFLLARSGLLVSGDHESHFKVIHNGDKSAKFNIHVSPLTEEAPIFMAASVSQDGYFLTANHGLTSGPLIWLNLFDGSSFHSTKIRIVTTFPEVDLAIIKIKRPFGPFYHASLDSPQVGQPIFSGGFSINEFTAGKITNVTQGKIKLGERSYPYYRIRTDAPLRPGDSGSALVNSKGKLTGINTEGDLSLLGSPPPVAGSTAYMLDWTLIQHIIQEDRKNHP